MPRPPVALLPTLLSALRSRRDLAIENLALRQQLATLVCRRHPDIRPADRVFWVLLRRLWSCWARNLAIVRPETVVRWHRAGSRIYWNWLSRRGKRSGRPPFPREVRALQVLFVIRHARREVVRCAVTTSPTAGWVAQQLREALPFESAQRFRIFDRGATFSAEVLVMLRSMKVEPMRTSFRSPWQNGIAERFVATVQRELLDSFVNYYNQDRTHLGISKDSPLGCPVEERPAGPTLGGRAKPANDGRLKTGQRS